LSTAGSSSRKAVEYDPANFTRQKRDYRSETAYSAEDDVDGLFKLVGRIFSGVMEGLNEDGKK
jgi:hypothetical protein